MKQPSNLNEVLVRFARMMANERHEASALSKLVDVVVDKLDVDAAAVLHVTEDRIALAATRNLPHETIGWTARGVFAPELFRGLLDSIHYPYKAVETLPMIAGGELFGALVLISQDPIDLGDGRREQLEALANIAATTAGRAAKCNEVARLSTGSHPELTDQLQLIGPTPLGISHDVRNILNPLSLQLEILRRHVGRGAYEEALATIVDMRKVISEGADLVDRLCDSRT